MSIVLLKVRGRNDLKINGLSINTNIDDIEAPKKVFSMILAGEFLRVTNIDSVKPDVKNSQLNNTMKVPTISNG